MTHSAVNIDWYAVQYVCEDWSEGRCRQFINDYAEEMYESFYAIVHSLAEDYDRNQPASGS